VYVTYYINRNFDINLGKFYNFVLTRAPNFLSAFEKLVLGFLIKRYDIFNFFFDRGILGPTQRMGINLRELDILRSAGKRVYAYAYGADVRLRQRTLGTRRWTFCTECPEPGRFCLCDDEIGSKSIAEISERVTGTVALGDMVPYVPGCRVFHYWPIDTEKMVPIASSPNADRPLRIAHAPNHSHFKGSHYLESAIAHLRQQGHQIEYVKVQGVPNSEVIRLFGETDIVADQFLGGGLGYTALEAMARAKPVLSYVPDPEFVQAPADCPVINTNPDTLEAVLTWILRNRELLPAIGRQGRIYIEKWHSIEAVAERLARMYEETADFPAHITDRLYKYRLEAQSNRAKISNVDDWHHPYMVSDSAPT